MIGTVEIVIICVVVLAVFVGPALLPKFGKNLGLGIVEFRKVGKEIAKGLKEGEEE